MWILFVIVFFIFIVSLKCVKLFSAECKGLGFLQLFFCFLFTGSCRCIPQQCPCFPLQANTCRRNWTRLHTTCTEKELREKSLIFTFFLKTFVIIFPVCPYSKCLDLRLFGGGFCHKLIYLFVLYSCFKVRIITVYRLRQTCMWFFPPR